MTLFDTLFGEEPAASQAMWRAEVIITSLSLTALGAYPSSPTARQETVPAKLSWLSRRRLFSSQWPKHGVFEAMSAVRWLSKHKQPTCWRIGQP